VGARIDTPSFDLKFRPSVELIALVRRFVEDFYQNVLDDDDMASRLALTTHELLENAAKYSDDGEARVQVELDRRSGTVVVRMSNRATAPRIDALRRFFEQISTATDATEFYAQTIRESAAQRSGSGGLGLARIWAESEMSVDLLVEADRVTIRAQGRTSTAG
jgi:hypothetical protein